MTGIEFRLNPVVAEFGAARTLSENHQTAIRICGMFRAFSRRRSRSTKLEPTLAW